MFSFYRDYFVYQLPPKHVPFSPKLKRAFLWVSFYFSGTIPSSFPVRFWNIRDAFFVRIPTRFIMRYIIKNSTSQNKIGNVKRNGNENGVLAYKDLPKNEEETGPSLLDGFVLFWFPVSTALVVMFCCTH